MLAFLLPLVITGVAILALGLQTYRESSIPLRTPFLMWTAVTAVIALTEALIHLCDDMGGLMFVNDVQYAANVLIGPTLLVGTLMYSGRSDLLTRRNLLLLSIVPLVTLALVWTNDIHHLYYASLSYQLSDGLTMFDPEWGPGWFLHIGYSFLLLSLATGLMFRFYRGAEGGLRKDARRLTEAMAFPIVFNFLLLSGSSVAAVYTATFGYTLTALWLFWVIFRYEVLDITPLAHEALMGNMDDGAVIVDNGLRIISVNASGRRLLGVEGEVKGSLLSDVSMTLADVAGNAPSGSGNGEEVLGGREHEISVTRMQDHHGSPLGHLIILRDVTERNAITRELESANTRLRLLNSTNRHDVLNRVTAAWGFTELLKGMELPPGARGYLARIESSMRGINDMISFTKGYQELGMKAPDWVSLGEAVSVAMGRLDLEGVRVIDGLDGMQVYADGLFDRVLLNLMDNSLRHGGEVSTITLSSTVKRGRLHLIYEDDGVGIPPEEKEAIFAPGHGRNTGIGLYACREILALTGISIHEDGREGARFEMEVPERLWRAG